MPTNAPGRHRRVPTTKPPRGRSVPLARPDLGSREVEFITQVSRSDTCVMGPFAPRFEAALAALPLVAKESRCSSGTAGLHRHRPRSGRGCCDFTDPSHPARSRVRAAMSDADPGTTSALSQLVEFTATPRDRVVSAASSVPRARHVLTSVPDGLIGPVESGRMRWCRASRSTVPSCEAEGDPHTAPAPVLGAPVEAPPSVTPPGRR